MTAAPPGDAVAAINPPRPVIVLDGTSAVVEAAAVRAVRAVVTVALAAVAAVAWTAEARRTPSLWQGFPKTPTS
jgi:hypothetical protein